MKRTITNSIRAKVVAALVLIAVPVVVSGLLAVVEARQRGQLFDAMWSYNVAVTTASHQGMAGSRNARVQLQNAVLLPEEASLAKIEDCDRRLREAELNVRVFVEFLTWGSDSEAFRTVMDGAVYREWTRQGWHRKLTLRGVPVEVRELAGQAGLYFAAFFKNAYDTLALQREALQRQKAGEPARARELAASARKMADRAMRFQALGNQNLNDMAIAIDAITEQSRLNVRTAHERRLRYLAIVDVGLLFAAVLVAWLFGDRVLVRPLLALAGTVQRIAAEKNYSRRAEKLTADEIGHLTDGFNQMLAGIEERDATLRAEIGVRQRAETQLRALNLALETEVAERRRAEEELRRLTETLERRVAERTTDLEAARVSALNIAEDAEIARHKAQQAEEALARQAQELARSNAELEQFAYVASHDLQEPLRMVASFTQLLGERYRGRLDTDADDFIRFAVDGAKRMQALINDLLAFSRVGRKGKPFEPVDCQRVLETARSNLQLAIEESRATITHDPLPTVTGDATQLTQLFQNLIGNGVKFRGPQPPRIHVSARRQGEDWVMGVQDNGIGIDHKDMGRLFQLFQRLHGRDEYPGTGIGLAVCKKIVERHGGRIWIESEPGRGSVFYFTLPAHASGDEPEGES